MKSGQELFQILMKTNKKAYEAANPEDTIQALIEAYKLYNNAIPTVLLGRMQGVFPIEQMAQNMSCVFDSVDTLRSSRCIELFSEMFYTPWVQNFLLHQAITHDGISDKVTTIEKAIENGANVSLHMPHCRGLLCFSDTVFLLISAAKAELDSEDKPIVSLLVKNNANLNLALQQLREATLITKEQDYCFAGYYKLECGKYLETDEKNKKVELLEGFLANEEKPVVKEAVSTASDLSTSTTSTTYTPGYSRHQASSKESDEISKTMDPVSVKTDEKKTNNLLS